MRRPLSPLPTQNFTEQGRFEKLAGYWQRMTNEADIVIEPTERPQVDIERELAQVAIIRGEHASQELEDTYI